MTFLVLISRFYFNLVILYIYLKEKYNIERIKSSDYLLKIFYQNNLM